MVSTMLLCEKEKEDSFSFDRRSEKKTEKSFLSSAFNQGSTQKYLSPAAHFSFHM